MSDSRNEFEFVGNLGTNPEVKMLDNGGQLTKIFIITNKKWKNKDTGELQERSEAFDVAVFGNHAKFLGDYARKGDKLLVKGEIRNREWQDKDTGQKRTGYEFIVSGYQSEVMLFGKPIKDNQANGTDQETALTGDTANAYKNATGG